MMSKLWFVVTISLKNNWHVSVRYRPLFVSSKDVWQSNEISTVAFSTACTCTAAPWSTGVQVCVSRPTVTDVGAKSVITVSPWGAVRLIQKTLIWIYKWQETNHISSQHVTSCGNSSNIKLHITCCHSLTSIHYLKIRPERVISTCYVYTVTVYYIYGAVLKRLHQSTGHAWHVQVAAGLKYDGKVHDYAAGWEGCYLDDDLSRDD